MAAEMNPFRLANQNAASDFSSFFNSQVAFQSYCFLTMKFLDLQGHNKQASWQANPPRMKN